jgi:hypothetical protein
MSRGWKTLEDGLDDEIRYQFPVEQTWDTFTRWKLCNSKLCKEGGGNLFFQRDFKP